VLVIVSLFSWTVIITKFRNSIAPKNGEEVLCAIVLAVTRSNLARSGKPLKARQLRNSTLPREEADPSEIHPVKVRRAPDQPGSFDSCAWRSERAASNERFAPEE